MSDALSADVKNANAFENKSKARLIDRDQRVRTKPMRVLVLGMCRTGTTSIRVALQKLGYTTHHMEAVLEEDPTQFPYWQEATEVTFFPDSERPVHLRGQPPYGRTEFDKLLANYDAVADFPCVLFSEQLVKAYPDAKVVLTNRDYDSWARSMEGTIWWIVSSRLARFCAVTNLAPWPIGDFLRFNYASFKAHSNSHWKDGPEARAAFDRHYALVRSIVPKENLLEFGPKFEWEPLCKFLGKDVPVEPYPRANDGKAMKRKIRGLWLLLAVYVGGSIGAPVAIAWAAWRWQDNISNFFGSLLGR